MRRERERERAAIADCNNARGWNLKNRGGGRKGEPEEGEGGRGSEGVLLVAYYSRHCCAA